MKHHPMDDILRPKYSAKRRARGKQAEYSDSADQDGANNASSAPAVSPIPHCRRSSRKIHQGETPIYSAKWHPLDHMLRENACSISDTKRDDHSKSSRNQLGDSSASSKDKEDFVTVKPDFRLNRDTDRAIGFHGTASIGPNSRRSARVSSSKDALPNYDMKYGNLICRISITRLTNFRSRYHVMDSTIRPKFAEKRLLRRSIHSESKMDVPVAPAWSKLQNPYLDRTSLEWAEIQDIDRCIYLLQRGAPLDSNTLPEDPTYDSLKKLLFDEGAIILDEFSSSEGTELLKVRYESVRLGLQNFFGSGPEPVNKKDWILSKCEGFDVYDWKRGSMYRKHRSDITMKGTKTTSDPDISGFVTPTAKRATKNHNNGPTVSSEDRSRSEVEMPTRIQYRKSEETDSNTSCTDSIPASEAATKRAVIVDLADDDELDRINETEESLVESMRGGYISSSIMSDTALAELLFPAEEFSDEASYDTVGLVSGDSTNSGHPNSLPTQADKTCDELHNVDPEAKTFDLDTSSDRGLGEYVSFGKEETTLDVEFDGRDRLGKAQVPKVVIRTRKRKSRADIAISVHEDLPGRTPLVKKIVAMNPSSPGTDIPKENLEVDGLVELSGQVEMGTPRPGRYHDAMGTRRVRRLRRGLRTT